MKSRQTTAEREGEEAKFIDTESIREEYQSTDD
jgi:hypothetical protein